MNKKKAQTASKQKIATLTQQVNPNEPEKRGSDARSTIEKHPFVILTSIAGSICSIFFAAVWGWHERELHVKSLELDHTIAVKVQELDSERTRIKFSIDNASLSLSTKDTFITAEQLDSSFSVMDGGVFAVPKVNEGVGRWAWKDRNEFELAVELVGNDELRKSLSEQQQKFLEEQGKASHLWCYESDQVTDVTVNGQILRMRPRAFFQRLTWKDISRIQTAENAFGVENFFDSMNRIGDDVDLHAITELEVTLYPAEKSRALISEDVERVTSDLAQISEKQLGRVKLFEDFVEEHLSADLANTIRVETQKKRVKLDQEKKRATTEAADRSAHPIVIEPNHLATFLAMFNSAGGQESKLLYGGPFHASTYSFKDDVFSVQGYYRISEDEDAAKEPAPKLYVLKLGFMREDGIYMIGFTYPSGEDLSQLKQMTSLIAGLRIIK